MLPSTSEIGVVHVSGTCHEWRYGFGYDCNSDDYKVLTLMTEEFACFNSSYKSIMYTLRTNSWRWIKDSPRPVGTYIAEKTSVFMNGALHWKAIVQRPCIAQKNGRSVVVVSFELTSETYTEVPLPQDVGVSSILHEVGASKGCLCFLSQDIYDGTDEIWVMKEYGVPESWTKTVKIPFVFGGIHCIRLMPMTWFVENGEILLNVRGKPASYNPNKDSIRYFATDDEVRVVYPECVSCEESLVSPNVYSNIVVNETCRLNIKIGHAVTKEEKDLEYEERKKQSSRAGMEIKAKKDRSLISFLNRFTSCLSIRRQI
uniref:F-box/kelch-repeat protein At3g06240-like n=1 Tax=Fragaria vesca subsp. vesca TaxID=101020 RepID=UPI0005C9A0FA|nr:PREDICTED: F-box/kelch-repeat protein At3g06240-like [Fragaria vesca subsp. vesca]